MSLVHDATLFSVKNKTEDLFEKDVQELVSLKSYKCCQPSRRLQLTYSLVLCSMVDICLWLILTFVVYDLGELWL